MISSAIQVPVDSMGPAAGIHQLPPGVQSCDFL